MSSGTFQWVEIPQPLEISKKVCQSPQHTHNVSSAVSKLPERLRLCSPVTKQLPRSSKAQERLLKLPNLLGIEGLDPKRENGREIDQIGQAWLKDQYGNTSGSHVPNRSRWFKCISIWQKNTSQKWSYSQIHDPLQGTETIWTKTTSQRVSQTFLIRPVHFFHGSRLGTRAKNMLYGGLHPSVEPRFIIHGWSETWPGCNGSMAGPATWQPIFGLHR